MKEVPSFKDLPDDITKARRNILITSSILFLYGLVGIKISTINSPLGKIELSSPDNIWLFIWILTLYFLWRYFQYYQKYNLKVFDKSYIKTIILYKQIEILKQYLNVYGTPTSNTRGEKIYAEFLDGTFIDNIKFKELVRPPKSIMTTEKLNFYHSNGKGTGEIETEFEIIVSPYDKMIYILKQPYGIEYIFPYIFAIFALFIGIYKIFNI